MFASDLKEKYQTEILLEEMHGNELKILIDFCYTGIIDITEDNVSALLEASARMNFDYVESKCGEFLIEKMNASNCLAIWTLVEPFINLKDIADMAMKIAEQNFMEAADGDQYLQIDGNHLLKLLKSDYLNVWSEEEVFNAFVKWVEYDVFARADQVIELLSAIRLPQLRARVSSKNFSKMGASFFRNFINVV